MKIIDAILKYLQEMKLLNRSPVTIKVTRYNLLIFARFLESEKVSTIEQLTSDTMEEYQQELAFRLTGKGKLLAIRSQEKHLNNAKCFTKFLYEKDYLVVDPGARIKLPKQPRRLPRIILDNGEIKKLFKASDMQSNQGIRDRITLELLYDTGVRCAEVANIKTHDLDTQNGYLHVREGKGLKDRVVPISSRVCGLIRDYLLVVRPTFIQGKDEGFFILNRWGDKMSNHGIYFTVKRCVKEAGIKKNVTTHTFRHTCATHMLRNGAPIRHIQELLGHESLESTQIYTKVTINDLKAVHAKYHPGESMSVR
jgi:integrase/recombinase XerD